MNGLGGGCQTASPAQHQGSQSCTRPGLYIGGRRGLEGEGDPEELRGALCSDSHSFPAETP